MAEALVHYNFDLVSGGSENHLLLCDLRNKKVNGRVAAIALEKAGIVLNYNGVPFDTMPPLFASGIRFGTPAITTRGMKEREMKKVAKWMNDAVQEVTGCMLPEEDKEKRSALMKEYRKKIETNRSLSLLAKEVKTLCTKFPLP